MRRLEGRLGLEESKGRGVMGQFRRLVFEYALKVKSKDEVFDEMLQLAQAAAGSGKLGDLPALKSLTGAGGLSGLGDVEALKGLVTEALKAVGLVDSGGQAKLMVREGAIRVNGEPALQPGRKLRAGDRFGIAGGSEWTIRA